MKPIDWNLLVLAAAAGSPLSPAQHQKALFLLSRDLPPAALGGQPYDFAAEAYGPFDAAVFADAARLAEGGLAVMTRARGGWAEYAATPRGIEEAKAIRGRLDPAVVAHVEAVVAWARSLSFPGLIRSILDAFPEMKVNCVFQP
jgi:hypothetical protein